VVCPFFPSHGYHVVLQEILWFRSSPTETGLRHRFSQPGCPVLRHTQLSHLSELACQVKEHLTCTHLTSRDMCVAPWRSPTLSKGRGFSRHGDPLPFSSLALFLHNVDVRRPYDFRGTFSQLGPVFRFRRTVRTLFVYVLGRAQASWHLFCSERRKARFALRLCPPPKVLGFFLPLSALTFPLTERPSFLFERVLFSFLRVMSLRQNSRCSFLP